MRPIAVLALAGLARLFALPACPTEAEDRALKWAIETQQAKRPFLDELLSRIELKPGMTMLDIGAGTGQLSYLVAERLGGTGAVIATEIDPALVGYISKEAERRGLKNLRAVLVQKEGLDKFYFKQSCDLIVLFDVFHFINDRTNYFRGLLGALKPGGKVVIVSEETDGIPFFEGDVADWNGLISDIQHELPRTAFGTRLRRPLLKVLRAKQGVDERGRAAVIYQMNRLLQSRLFDQFVRGTELDPELAFDVKERAYATWIFRHLPENLPHHHSKDPLDRDTHLWSMLNKLLLIQRYRRRLTNAPPAPYLSSAESILERFDPGQFVMERAGYRMDSREPMAPFYRVRIFSKP